MTQAGGGSLAPEKSQAFLVEAAGAAKDIDSLLTSMVAYCGVTSGGSSVGLQILLRGVLIELKDALAVANAKVELSNELDIAVPATLKAVFRELILNACRFQQTDVPLSIRIQTSASGDSPESSGMLEATISDNGIGVGEAYLEKIFDPFQRLHSRNQHYSGHGLGLSMCRRVISLNGGNIRAEANPSGGLVIRFSLPFSQNA